MSWDTLLDDVDASELDEPHLWLLLYQSYKEMAQTPGATKASIEEARRLAKDCRKRLAHYIGVPYISIEEKLIAINKRGRRGSGTAA